MVAQNNTSNKEVLSISKKGENKTLNTQCEEAQQIINESEISEQDQADLNIKRVVGK